MKNLGTKHIAYIHNALLLLNFIIVLFNASIFLLSTKYLQAHGYASAFLENLSYVPPAPEKTFFGAILLFLVLLASMYFRTKDSYIVYWLIYLEIIVMITLIIVLNGSYNGIVLLVFADILYNTKKIKYWPALLIISFGLLLISDYAILSLIVRMPSIETYINFYPSGARTLILFFRNILASLNIVGFISFLAASLFVQQKEKQRVGEQLAMVSRVNVELKNYANLTEKIGEDNERKRISREIHDTLGHALTGISAGVDACIAIIDIDPEKTKQQLLLVSDVVRMGIKDVRRSLYKLRPGALEDSTLKDGLTKMIAEYEGVSNLKIDLYYKWDNVDIENTKEDIIFRMIQESITNSLRHGHATEIEINMFVYDNEYVIIIQDNGTGCESIKCGYGLKQMCERVSILNGTIRFSGENGFRTAIEIPIERGANYD